MISTSTITGLVPTIPAYDLDKEAEFYRSALGLEDDPEYSSIGDEDAVMLKSGDFRLLVYKTEAARGEHTLASFMVRGLDDLVADLRSKGVSFEEFDWPRGEWRDGVLYEDGMKAAWFRDPEGGFIALTEID